MARHWVQDLEEVWMEAQGHRMSRGLLNDEWDVHQKVSWWFCPKALGRSLCHAMSPFDFAVLTVLA